MALVYTCHHMGKYRLWLCPNIYKRKNYDFVQIYINEKSHKSGLGISDRDDQHRDRDLPVMVTSALAVLSLNGSTQDSWCIDFLLGYFGPAFDAEVDNDKSEKGKTVGGNWQPETYQTNAKGKESPM